MVRRLRVIAEREADTPTMPAAPAAPEKVG